MVGLVHRTAAEITGLEDGKPLAFMFENCSLDGLTLEAFHTRITTELLMQGRFSILVDVPSGDGSITKPAALPYFAGYTAERLINWAEIEKDLFVFDETREERIESEFVWTRREHYRVLRLEGNTYTAEVYDNTEAVNKFTPQMLGGKTFQEIPLVVVGPRDLRLAPEEPPLFGVGRACLAIFRLDADYRHQLHMSGQETLFIMGLTDDLPNAVGAGVVVGLPPDSDAKYVGPQGVGINAHRVAIQDERANAVREGLRLFDQGGQRESGEALRLRASAQTTTLTTISQASAAALEKALRYAAMFVGQDPLEITVKPNLKFVDSVMTPQDATFLMQVWQGGGISKETLYENFQRGEIASTERTFEEEQALIEKEVIDNPLPVGPGAVIKPDPNNPAQQPPNNQPPNKPGGNFGDNTQ
jgi:hypothetical protein